MLGILDTQFVVQRVAQLARWARDRGGKRARRRPRGRAGSSRTSRPSAPAAPSGPALNLRSPAHRTERELLKLALQSPDLVSPAFDAYGVDEFTAPPYAAVRQAIAEAGGAECGVAGPAEYLVRVRDAAPDDTVRALVTELAVEVVPRARRSTRPTRASSWSRSACAPSTAASTTSRAASPASAASGDPAHLAAVQNELWVLQQYAQALRERGAAAL